MSSQMFIKADVFSFSDEGRADQRQFMTCPRAGLCCDREAPSPLPVPQGTWEILSHLSPQCSERTRTPAPPSQETVKNDVSRKQMEPL